MLTAQRRMGKTSLVRELQRRLVETGDIEAVFVDLEAAGDPADAIAEIGIQAKPVHAAWDRIAAGFTNLMKNTGSRIEELSITDLKVKLRAGIDAGNWPQRGDAILAALANNDRPVVLAVDVLPILVNRLLKDEAGRITPEGKRETDAFLSWLRKAGQSHRNQVTFVISGSISLEPLLEQAGLSAQANIFSAYDLKPWSEETAVNCLGALAESYEIGLAPEVRQEMYRRLRCGIPHHVQMFFDKIHDHLRRTGRTDAALDDVERVYMQEMQGVRGQVDLQHYEGRLETILGRTGYTIALEILTATAVSGGIGPETVDGYRNHFSRRDARDTAGEPSVDHVLHVLQHDGYLEPGNGGYRFVSSLLEDWWRGRYGQGFAPVFEQRR
ncbi:MAG: hypothetical protein OXE84_12525 [Rhodobacteraceae bacterium]|nr:hypothetical protein [Paracoccaceae bacterium]